MKNFHIPLPDGTWSDLKAEAERSRLPATSVAREAIRWWLRVRKKASRNAAIAAYAAKLAGTEVDLDADLEAATIELLMESEREAR